MYCPGGHRRYPLSTFVDLEPEKTKKKVLYARVSTRTQMDALQNQIQYLSEQYPGYPVVKDIASGMNWKRKQFMKLMEQVAAQEIETIVVAHKDRLCRFGFEFVEWFCNLNGCQIIVLNNEKLSPYEELMKDFMDIMHCMSSKLYFLRAYTKKIQEDFEKENPKNSTD